MKNVIFGLATIILFIFNANAQDKQNLDQKGDFKYGSIIISFNKETTEYKFKSLDDLSEEIEEIIKEIDLNSIENVKGICEVEIEVKLEIEIGVTKIEVSEIITTNGMEETLTLVKKRLKAVLLAVIG